MLFLRDASEGVSRLDQLLANLGIAPNILTRCVAALTADGLLERRRYCERPPRDEYVLTEARRAFLPFLVPDRGLGPPSARRQSAKPFRRRQNGSRGQASVL